MTAQIQLSDHFTYSKLIRFTIPSIVMMIFTSIYGVVDGIFISNFAGENGVAAYGVIGYMAFIFIGIFFGYYMGIAPVISFHYGADNRDELKNLFKKSLKLLCSAAVVVVIFAELLSRPLAYVFVGYDSELLEMTVHGMRIFCLAFIFAGVTVFGSGFFTALNNGLISAVISFMRTLVFECAAVMLLPLIFGPYGVWGSIIIAELAAVTVAIIFFVKLKDKYHYL